MSESVWIALITTAGNILAIAVSRLLSHREHKSTNALMTRLEDKLNGHEPD